MNILTEETDLDAIRDVLGIDSRDASDVVLRSPAIIPAAELVVKGRVSNWSALIVAGGDDAIRVKLGTIYHAAVFLLPRLRNILRESERIAELVLGKMDWNQVRMELLGRADEVLGQIGNKTNEPGTLFSVAGPSRRYYQLQELSIEDLAEFQNV